MRSIKWSFALAVCLLTSFAAAQTCTMPVVTTKEPVIFTPEQEKRLGEVVADRIAVQTILIEDEDVVGPLRRIGDRLAKLLPPGTPKPKWFVTDTGEANAFTIPGAQVYVSRRMITVARSEDELAAVMAHELGHMVARDPAVLLSRLWTAVLKKNSIGSLAEIEPDYHQILDTYRKNSNALEKRDRTTSMEKLQHGADDLGNYLLARAGYSPQAAVDIFDRVSGTKGQTGSFFSDLFGSTRPDSKRLREIVKTVSNIPASCVEKGPRPTAAEFERWRQTVMAHTFKLKASEHRIVSQQQLSPALQGDIMNVRFSPDGKYALVQTDVSIYVVTMNPLQYLFEFTARDMYPAIFSPDSRQIVFYDSELRVERWDVATQQQSALNEVYVAGGCLDSALSPDGRWLACVQTDQRELFPLQLSILNVSSGAPVYNKKSFYSPASMLADTAYSDAWSLLIDRVSENPAPFINLQFSPDGKYLLAGRRSTHLAIHLDSMSEVKLPGTITALLGRKFVFVGPDRLYGIENGKSAAVVGFPSGERLYTEPPIGGRIQGAAHGEYLLIRPLQQFAVGIFDLKTQKVVSASPNSAMDIYDSAVLNPQRSGTIAAYHLTESGVGKEAPRTLTLPQTMLGSLFAVNISPDFKFVAVSQRERGGVWNLEAGTRLLHIRGFRGAWFGENNHVYALFPPDPLRRAVADVEVNEKSKDKPKNSAADKPSDPQIEFSLAEMDLNTGGDQVRQWFNHEVRMTQAGSFLIERQPVKKDQPWGDWTVEVRDVHAPTVLWSRQLRHQPSFATDSESGTIAFIFGLDRQDAKDLMKSDNDLRQRVQQLKNQQAVLVDVVDLKTGQSRSRFAVDTGKGSIRIRDVSVKQNQIMVLDNQKRVLLYNLAGEPKGHVFGSYAIASRDGKFLCVEQKPGILSVLDSGTLEKRDEFSFPSWISAARFSADGNRLGVLTADQKFYVLEIGSSGDRTLTQDNSALQH
ncbi:MAG: M48 family metalloprotease [Terriglobales bacterium]